MLKPKSSESRLINIISFLIVFMTMCSIALVREHKIFGITPGNVKIDPITRVSDTDYIINTTETGKDITGYAGQVPLLIYVSGNRIDSVRPLENSETPGFFSRLKTNGLFDSWNGKSISEAQKLNVDVVTGATYSSNAVIENVKSGIDEVLKSPYQSKSYDKNELKYIIAILVICLGAFLPLCVRNRHYRTIQQILNVSVLGFWAGEFINYTMMIGFFSNALHYSLATLIIWLLLFIAFIYPIIGLNNHYCNWICPLGSFQELAGKLRKKKFHLSESTVNILNTFRNLLWVFLLLSLWSGFWISWIDNELFSAFIISSASWIVIVAGILFIILSVFIPRPFCRFVCPTGTIISKSENINHK